MPSSTKKILHIITRLDMGGSAQNTLLTCLKLSRKYEMILVCGLSQESNMTDLEREAVEDQRVSAQKMGVRIVAVQSLVRPISPVSDIIALYNLVRLIQTEKPDVVHTHTSKAGLLGRLAAKIAKVPIIVHTPHGHVFSGHFGPLLSRIFLWIEMIGQRSRELCHPFSLEAMVEKNHQGKVDKKRSRPIMKVPLSTCLR
jgi:hypothetical protein